MNFQLLNGLKYGYGLDSSSGYRIMNADKAISIIVDRLHRTIMALGIFMKSKLIIFPNREMAENTDNQSFVLRKNALKFLTRGQCIDYDKCVQSIDKYKKYIGSPNIVFQVFDNSKFNFVDLKKSISENDWHFIVGGSFWLIKNFNEVQSLVNLYGIKITRNNYVQRPVLIIRNNICKNATNN